MANVDFNDGWIMTTIKPELQSSYSQIHLSLALVESLLSEFRVAIYSSKAFGDHNISTKDFENMAFVCKTVMSCLESALYSLAHRRNEEEQKND